MKPTKIIKGHSDTGYGVIMTNGKEAQLYSFDRFGNYVSEHQDYVKRAFEIYCEKKDLKIKN